MNRLKFLIIIVLGIFLVAASYPAQAAATDSASAPAAASTVKMTIDNKSIAAVTLTLKGSQNYTIIAPIGKSIHEVAKGKYTFEYKACGQQVFKGKITISAPVKFKIAKCQMARIYIQNYTSGSMTLTLRGPANYSFTVPAKTQQRVDVLAGEYRWTITACGKSNSGTIKLKGKRNVARAWGC
jgi:hypothetical protein